MKNCESNIIKNNILEMECPHTPTGQPSSSIPPVGQPSSSIPPVGQASTSILPRRTGVSPVYCIEQDKQDVYSYIPPVGQASRLSNKSWKRHLQHFQLSAGYYFITLVTYNRTLLQPSQKDCIFNALNFLNGKKYELYAAVILNDHLHMIINPTDSLSKIMHSIKSFTAHEINKQLNRKGKVWQDESMDKVIRSEKEFIQKVNYIVNNPITAHLAQRYADYKWLYIKDWINDNK